MNGTEHICQKRFAINTNYPEEQVKAEITFTSSSSSTQYWYLSFFLNFSQKEVWENIWNIVTFAYMHIISVDSNFYNQLVCAERVVTTYASEPFKRSKIIPPPQSPKKTNFDATSNSNAVKPESPA